MTPILDAIFGNRSAAQALLFIQAYGQGNANQIATTYGASQTGIYRQLVRLEAEGVFVSRLVGKARIFEFNTRNPTVRNLREFLATELENLPDEMAKQYYRERQRPRRTKKAL